MDKDTRSAIERATQRARKLLEEDFASQLEGTFDVLRDGTVAPKAGSHLSPREVFQRDKIVAAIEHKRAAGMTAVEAVADYLRDAAFTALNRFVALKLLEARELVQECITKGDQSAGYREFCGMAPGVALLPESTGYRLYIESLFDELSTEVKVLFNRRDAASVLWPRRACFEALLVVLNRIELAGVWNKDETIGWIYQYYNDPAERKKMRDESAAPRNSRELAVRNQFFTPRYVVEFLTDNTLGRIWYEMTRSQTRLKDQCRYLVRRPHENFLQPGEAAPEEAQQDKLSQEQLLQQTVHIPHRPLKDPREIRMLDPACGSMHFGLYAFDLFEVIYDEAWEIAHGSDEGRKSSATFAPFVSFVAQYPNKVAFLADVPRLIIEHNLHGIDIDPRAVQIAGLSLWLRAQRSWQRQGLRSQDRPRIRRSNIVCAEPMPGEEAFLDEFIEAHFSANPERKLLGQLVRRVFDAMKLAGEAGSLLKIEEEIAGAVAEAKQKWFAGPKPEQGRLFADDTAPPLQKELGLDVTGITDETFWTQAEERIYAALQSYTEQAEHGGGYQRRLFADDAGRGFAFVDLLRTRFDVLLMNPPFGDATPTAAEYLERTYYETRLDLFAAFVSRLLGLAEERGLIGAITPRDGFFKKTLAGWRNLVLQNDMSVVADLGIGVLDAATVRVAAYVIARGHLDAPTRFIDLLDVANREERLKMEISVPQCAQGIRMSSFRMLPLSRFLYWLPTRLWEIFTSAGPLENRACTPRYGLTTLSDERFCRLSFEVDPRSIGPTRAWAFMSKGGDDFPYGGLSNSLVRWQDEAAEMAEVNRQANGQIAQTRRASKYYFQPAVTFSNRSVQFSVRWHPANFVFSVRGPAIIPLDASQAYLLGFFNSRLIRALIQMQTASQTYTSGVLKELRWVEPDVGARLVVEGAAREAFEQVRRRLATVETDPFFGGIIAKDDASSPRTVFAYFAWRRHFVDDLNEVLASVQSTIDHAIAGLYGVSVSNIERCERVEEGTEPRADFPPQFAFASSDAEALVSYLFGVALGRWTPCIVEHVPSLDESASATPPASSPSPEVLPIVVADAGHRQDIVSLVETALRRILPDVTDGDVVALERALGGSLREWLARTFFTKHIAAYSSFGRSAPVYWQLATPSANYSVWLYLHAFTKDTLYKVQNDYVASKLVHEERKLESLRNELGESPTAAERKTLAAQDTLVDELRAFLDEVKRVAPLWNPTLDDGVIINFSLLWRLVPQNKAWQRELKATWDSLCAGDYDWAHLAMHLWPERVVPKCATDRSLAIAQSLESEFWVKGADGKWKARPMPLRPLEELVRERSSPAVKAALKSLTEAPVARLRGSGRRPRSSAANYANEQI